MRPRGPRILFPYPFLAVPGDAGTCILHPRAPASLSPLRRRPHRAPTCSTTSPAVRRRQASAIATRAESAHHRRGGALELTRRRYTEPMRSQTARRAGCLRCCAALQPHPLPAPANGRPRLAKDVRMARGGALGGFDVLSLSPGAMQPTSPLSDSAALRAPTYSARSGRLV